VWFRAVSYDLAFNSNSPTGRAPQEIWYPVGVDNSGTELRGAPFLACSLEQGRGF
jgi:hypothetical protein